MAEILPPFQFEGDANSAFKEMSNGIRANGPGAYFDPYLEKYFDNLVARENAQAERAWQTEMSNTSYQRAVDDLKAAGLNPWMLGSGMSGASVGSVGAAGVSNISAGLGQRAASVSDTKIAQEAIKETRNWMKDVAGILFRGAAASLMKG